MALLLTDEQSMLRDSAHGFLADHAPVARLRQLRDAPAAAGFSRELWKQFAALGFTGILVPESDGGLGLGHVEAGVVMEQIGRHLSVVPFLASCIVAVTAIRHAGTPAQRRELLPKIASGECIASLAVDEHLKHRPDALALKAMKTATGYRLDGRKTFVGFGHAADLLIVAAFGGSGEASASAAPTAPTSRTPTTPTRPTSSTHLASDAERQRVTLFAIDPHSVGLTIESVAMVDSQPWSRVVFDGVDVPFDAVLGTVGDGAEALGLALDAGRAGVAAELVGLADEAFDRTVAFLKERRQFDRVIGEFQGLQHRAAMLYCDIELARAATLKALHLLDGEAAADGTATAGAVAVAVAKARAGRSATLAVQEGVQMHGGMGMTDEFEMGFFMKRARVLQELYGDSNFHADRLARQRGY